MTVSDARRLKELQAENSKLKKLLVESLSITVDHGPEFEGQVLDAWAYEHHVQLSFIRPGKPVENAYIESFNGRFRDES
jgi:putative transposase